ncbi:MBL fold metallo-hydrolase [Sphingomonas sp.]|uniref:MBL fold metallo-hydrolase n=1 Tax=Sphingomonas sp. TaxID=28214 RepID=UPI003B3B8804
MKYWLDHMPSQVAASLVLPLLCGFATPASAQQTPYDQINTAAAESPITVTTLRGGVTLLQGSGGNMLAIAGAKGLLTVEDGIAVSQAKIQSALRQVGAGPITYVINTHWHWDHTDGNRWANQNGATLIGHVNTAKHLTQTIRVVEWGHTFPPQPAGGRIAMLVGQEKMMAFGGETIRMRHYAPSHTDGDLSVHFQRADILATGDTWWNGLYPFIDYVAGGSIDGMIRAANDNIAMAGPDTIVIPGHGPLGGRAELIEYRDMLVGIRGNVAALKHQGKSLEETIAAQPTAAYDAKWGQAIISPALFTTLVYRGI